MNQVQIRLITNYITAYIKEHTFYVPATEIVRWHSNPPYYAATIRYDNSIIKVVENDNAYILTLFNDIDTGRAAAQTFAINNTQLYPAIHDILKFVV